MSAANIRKAIAALTVTKDGIQYRPPLIEHDSPEEILQGVRAMLGFLQLLASAKAEIQLHGLPTPQCTKDYIEGEHVVLGMLKHALAVAEVLLAAEKGGGA